MAPDPPAPPVHDSATIPALELHDIQFRPVAPGLLTVWSAPKPVPSASKAKETHQLGSATLLRPGHPSISTKTAPIGSHALGLQYEVQPDDLDGTVWTCRLVNGTDINVLFETTINQIVVQPAQTASFDIGLLNLIFGHVATVAAARFHLMTSPPSPISPPDPQNPPTKASCVTWSQTLAATIGSSSYAMHLGDFVKDASTLQEIATMWPVLVFRPVRHLSTGPISLTVDEAEPVIHIAMSFGSGTLDCLNDDSVEIIVHSLDVTLDLNLDGTVNATNATANARVIYHSLDVADASSEIEDRAKDAVAGFVTNAPPLGKSGLTLKQLIDSFFVRLMRLNEPASDGGVVQLLLEADVHGYRVHAGQLLVDYTTSPHLLGTP
jgi:hypothetical protein